MIKKILQKKEKEKIKEDEKIFKFVFVNKYLLDRISYHVKEIHRLLVIEPAMQEHKQSSYRTDKLGYSDMPKRYSFRECKDGHWMLVNGFKELFMYKLEKIGRESILVTDDLISNLPKYFKHSAKEFSRVIQLMGLESLYDYYRQSWDCYQSLVELKTTKSEIYSGNDYFLTVTKMDNEQPQQSCEALRKLILPKHKGQCMSSTLTHLLGKAALCGDLGMVIELCSRRADFEWRPSFSRYKHFHYNVDCFKYIVQDGSKIGKVDQRQRTTSFLCAAVSTGSVELVELAISKKYAELPFNPHVVSSENADLVRSAIGSDSTEMIDWVLKSVNIATMVTRTVPGTFLECCKSPKMLAHVIEQFNLQLEPSKRVLAALDQTSCVQLVGLGYIDTLLQASQELITCQAVVCRAIDSGKLNILSLIFEKYGDKVYGRDQYVVSITDACSRFNHQTAYYAFVNLLTDDQKRMTCKSLEKRTFTIGADLFVEFLNHYHQPINIGILNSFTHFHSIKALEAIVNRSKKDNIIVNSNNLFSTINIQTVIRIQHIPVMQWLIDNNHVKVSIDHLSYSASIGSKSMFIYFFNLLSNHQHQQQQQSSLSSSSSSTISSSSSSSSILTIELYQSIIGGGNIDLLDWVVSLDIERFQTLYVKRSIVQRYPEMGIASRNGHIDMIDLHHRLGMPPCRRGTEALDEAVDSRNLSIIHYLVENGISSDVGTYLAVIPTSKLFDLVSNSPTYYYINEIHKNSPKSSTISRSRNINNNNINNNKNQKKPIHQLLKSFKLIELNLKRKESNSDDDSDSDKDSDKDQIIIIEPPKKKREVKKKK